MSRVMRRRRPAGVTVPYGAPAEEEGSGGPRPLVSALVVSYNVRELLLETLEALFEGADLPLEAIVVDNASKDGSADAVANRYPEAKVIRLDKNVGFGRANNMGLQRCRGRFVLLLNPDVLLAPGSLAKMADFMLVRPDVGAVGPRLRRPDDSLDRAARRAFPTPATAFYRFTGLNRLFPKSRRFNRYNLGYLDQESTHEIDAGTAACLLVRRAAIDRVGLFDPDYFMYGEDLDLCFRLKTAGWKIFYLPTADAVHVKGAATRQAALRMLFEFHRAMWTFHHKHYAEDLPAFANGVVWLAIWLRWAGLTVKALASKDPVVSP
ncbi:MAG TPA: glycosyltransferase family 2 protein [Candidatus Dormibacteraeota bacterium]